MDYDEFIFTPRYTLPTRLVIIGLPILFALLFGVEIFSLQAKWGWLLTFMVGLAAAVAPFFVVRRIHFRDRLVVKRYLVPDAYIEHKDIIAVTNRTIQTTTTRIHLGKLLNPDEFHTIFQRWKAVKLLNEAGNRAHPRTMLLPSRGLGSYVFIWALLFSLIVLFMLPEGLNMDIRWLVGGAFTVFYFGMLFFLRRL